jgi:hypothetical protein
VARRTLAEVSGKPHRSVEQVLAAAGVRFAYLQADDAMT